jgi:DNA uptake protein ComE-like DNA-binding protein
MRGPLDWMVRKLEFTKDQAKGSFYLGSLVFVIILGMILFDQLYNPPLVFAAHDESFKSYMDSVLSNEPVIAEEDSKIEITNVESRLNTSANRERKEQVSPDTIHLNACNAEDLKKIRGIGEKLSARIVKYRDKLGGFVSSEQLYEVYFIDSAAIKSALPYIQVNQSSVKKINVNTCTFKELLYHPYYDYETVKMIFRQRDQGLLTPNGLTSLLETKKDVNVHAFNYLKFE